MRMIFLEHPDDGGIAAFYLADEVDDRIAELEAAFQSQAQLSGEVIEDRNKRIAELEKRIQLVEFNSAKGACVIHFWGAPPGEDKLPCPFCIGIERGR